MDNNTITVNENESCRQPYDAGIDQKVGKTVALSFIMSLSLVGNLLVVLVIKRNSATRTNTNFFIANMAVSDLLFPLFKLPHEVVVVWLGRGGGSPVRGRAGEFLCKFPPFMTDISLAVSIQSLVLIAVERFTVVVYPLKAKNLTSRRRTVAVIATWIAAAVLHSPYFYFFRLETSSGTFYCIIDSYPLFDTHSPHEIYGSTLFILLVYIPLFVIAVLYTWLSLKLRRMKAPGNHVGNTQDIRRRERNKRITKMSICIVIAFAVCFLPGATCSMLKFHSTLSIQPYVYTFALFLMFVNGVINPLLLFYFCSNFRQGLRDMFGCCPCFTHGSNPVIARNIELRETRQDAQEN